jgi:hypothetical protein
MVEVLYLAWTETEFDFQRPKRRLAGADKFTKGRRPAAAFGLFPQFYAIGLALKTVRLRPKTGKTQEHKSSDDSLRQKVSITGEQEPTEQVRTDDHSCHPAGILRVEAGDIRLCLWWMCRHSDDHRNDAADNLAKEPSHKTRCIPSAT